VAIKSNKLVSSTTDGNEITIDKLVNVGIYAFIYRNVNDDQDVNASEFIKADTSGGAITLTLPSSPTDNDQLFIWDATGSFDKNNCTLDGNGTKVMDDNTFVLDTKNKNYWIIYDNNSSEWRVS